MRPFTYDSPRSVDEALQMMGRVRGKHARFLAGGTTLVDLMKLDVETPTHLIDITGVRELASYDVSAARSGAGELVFGALAHMSDVADDPVVRAEYPALSESLWKAASQQLRNMATIGGNLLQRTRCAYFYDTASRCNKREAGSGCDAREGENRTHAVLGWSESCIATHPSDFCVPLVALDAVVEIEGRNGRREIALDALHRLPGNTPERETALEPGDLIVAVRLPPAARSFAAHARYLKVRERTSYAFAVVSTAAALRIENGKIAEARLALGGVAAKPWRARAAEDVLKGVAPTSDAFQEAAWRALTDAKPSGDNAFKIELARRIVVRALTLAAAGTPARIPALPASPFASTSGAIHA